MNIFWIICGASVIVFIIFMLILSFSLCKSAKEADEMMHEAFLEEVEKLKKEHKDEMDGFEDERF